MTHEDEALRLRRELADAKVEQLQARLAELGGGGQPAPQQPGQPPQVVTSMSGTSPVVTVTSNSVASPEAQAALRQMLDRFGLGQFMPNPGAPGTSYPISGLGYPTPGQPITPPADLMLSTPPRRVPFGYRLFFLPWSTLTVFMLFMIAVSPIALWIFYPLAGVIVGAATFLVVIGFAVRRYRRLMALLKWGVPATSVQPVPLDVGTYYSGTTYQNVRLPIAHGWKVVRQFYSGPGTKTRVKYQTSAGEGELTLRGREYIDGVILADSRKPSRAACVTSIPFDLSQRTPSGDWTGNLRVGTIIGAVAMLAFVVAWTALMIVVCGRQTSVDFLSFLG